MTSGLPAGLTSFVGRRRDVAEVRRLLSASRLVTLTGPGGVGKTRLALEAAIGAQKLFADGAVLVELEQVQDQTLVTNAVATSLGLREQAGRAPIEMLIDYLAPRRLLLVLDNSEHVIDAVAGLAGSLLQGCRDLRILATSREALAVQGEVVVTVPPLTLPEQDGPPEQDLLQSEAVALFADRAASALPDFVVTPENGPDVAEICRRLDGLPLAIELAAARIRAMTERDILGRLSGNPHLLTAGVRNAPARQRTLRSCIEWSCGLCSPREQLLWARLTVFVGGFELDAAEAVCTGEDLAATDVLETVASLVDKSILVGERHADVVRYRMLETIREFGWERLQQTGQDARLRDRHRDWYLELVERADSDWVSPRQEDWFARLDREHANVQAAINHSLTEPGAAEPAMRILTAVFHFYWWGRGWAREGRLWLARALDQASPPSAVRARALLTDASLALADGDLESGRERLAEASVIADTLDEPAIAAHACWISGSASMYGGDLAGSIATFEQGLAALPPGRDLPLRLDLLLSYAVAAGLVGDEDRALACHRESLQITEPAGECFHRSYALWALGLLAMQQGDHRRAAELHQQSLRLRRGVRDLTGVGWSLESLAWTESALGNLERAAQLLGGADKLWEIMGRPLQTYQHLFPYHEECTRTAQERLGDGRFQALFDEGRAMSIDDAIAYALDEVPATAPAPTPEAESTDVLTRREREIAQLIAEGLSNRDIAARLVISVRTVETHAQNILIKLGFSSRAQVAARMAEQRAAASGSAQDDRGS